MKTIALVEDEKDLNNLIRTYLEKEGYNVVSYYDGENTINNINKDVDLWILDIMLGDTISGYDIIKKIREENPDVPVIFLPGRCVDLTKPPPTGSVIPAKITGVCPSAVLANDKAAGEAIPTVKSAFSLANFCDMVFKLD